MNRLLLLAVVIGAALLGAGGMYFAGRMGTPIASDRARTEQIVHDYLVSHPEVLVEASSALRRRQSGQAIDADKAAILEPFGTAWAGNPQGDLTIVEYFDYNCGYCRSTLPAIDALIAGDPKLRVVYRDWPILSEESATAARYSLVAADMGKFAEFHRALYAGGPVSDATLAAAVTTAGLDLAKVQAAAKTPRIEAELARNLEVAKKLGMSGTPSWVIGDQVISSALPIEELQRLVAEARAAR